MVKMTAEDFLRTRGSLKILRDGEACCARGELYVNAFIRYKEKDPELSKRINVFPKIKDRLRLKKWRKDSKIRQLKKMSNSQIQYCQSF